MIKPVCPTCGRAIPLDDINVSTDVMLCRACAHTFSFARTTATQGGDPVDLGRPPRGAWFTRSVGGFTVGASTRSPMAFFAVPFMCVWSGGSLSGIYGRQLAQGEFELFPSLFGIPFLLGTLVMGAWVLMLLGGKVVVHVEGDQGHVFTGIGRLGWRRSFAWREVHTVSLIQKAGNRSSREQISLQGQTRLDFASGLNAERRHFMLAALRQMSCAR